jgi:hypothetical protein
MLVSTTKNLDRTTWLQQLLHWSGNFSLAAALPARTDKTLRLVPHNFNGLHIE